MLKLRHVSHTLFQPQGPFAQLPCRMVSVFSNGDGGAREARDT